MNRPLNIVALAWDSSQGILLLPLQTQSWQLAVAPGLNIPLYTWTLNRPCQWLKVFIISSHRPLPRFSQLSSHPSHSEPLLISGEDSLALVLGLLGDLSSERKGMSFAWMCGSGVPRASRCGWSRPSAAATGVE